MEEGKSRDSVVVLRDETRWESLEALCRTKLAGSGNEAAKGGSGERKFWLRFIISARAGATKLSNSFGTLDLAESPMKFAISRHTAYGSAVRSSTERSFPCMNCIISGSHDRLGVGFDGSADNSCLGLTDTVF